MSTMAAFVLTLVTVFVTLAVGAAGVVLMKRVMRDPTDAEAEEAEPPTDTGGDRGADPDGPTGRAV
jgi:hypothetical protein